MDERDLTPFFFEIHRDNPREGPGNRDSTARAFRLLEELPARPRILDVGCGPGMQTLHLAELTDGDITAVDNHPPFLEALGKRLAEARLEHRVHALHGDMSALEFEPGSFDLIWSEGAIYIMGFEQGLRRLQALLEPGGYMAVTELTWLQDNPPEDVRAFFEAEYPAMQSVDANLNTIETCGFRLTGYFVLPASAWWDDYYDPIAAKLGDFRRKHRGNDAAQAVADMEDAEMAMFRRHSDVYGYVFYTMRLPPPAA